MEAASPILGNPLLVVAIILFLAILPRALRQKQKTALDRAVDRFEEEELKTAAEGESNENIPEHEQTTHPEDETSANLTKKDLPTSLESQVDTGIPPFPTQAEEIEKPVKIVKEGIPISHNELEEALPAAKKQVKLVKQEISIVPDKNKASSKNILSETMKDKTRGQDQSLDEDFPESHITDHEKEQSDDSWVESEIPGLVMDPPPDPKIPPSILTFNAFPKTTHPSEGEKSAKPLQKEKQRLKVKNIAPKSEEIKDSKHKQKVKITLDSPKLEIEISEPKPKTVEIKSPIASHKNIAKKTPEQKEANVPSAKAGKAQKLEPEVTAAPPQQENTKTSPEKMRPKPFLLELKYLDQEELESISKEKLPADMMDAVIARLHELQVDLENQLVSTSHELNSGDIPIDGNMRKNRRQESLPDSEGTLNEMADKKLVSLEELDSFLFTTTQRKNRE